LSEVYSVATTPSTVPRAKPKLALLNAEADKAVARADAAKQQVRSAKSELKKARKLSKTAKKAAKQARRKVEAARAAIKAGALKAARAGTTGSIKPAKPPKAVSAPQLNGGTKHPAGAKPAGSQKSPEPQTPPVKRPRPGASTRKRGAKPQPSAADVAKSVIKRMAAPKPAKSPSDAQRKAVSPSDATSEVADPTSDTAAPAAAA
jgi:colicin import membrane protein